MTKDYVDNIDQLSALRQVYPKCVHGLDVHRAYSNLLLHMDLILSRWALHQAIPNNVCTYVRTYTASYVCMLHMYGILACIVALRCFTLLAASARH